MSSTATQIAKIISTPNPSAPSITHALAEFGNGCMQNGLQRIVSYFAAKSAANLRLGRIQGGLIGILCTAAVAECIVLIYHNTEKQLKAEDRVILDALQKQSTMNTVIVVELPIEDIGKTVSSFE